MKSLVLAGGLFLTWVAAGLDVPAVAQDAPLLQAEHAAAWHITPLLDDAGLAGQFVFNVDFDAAGTTWVASSDGLLAFDGYTWRRYTTDDGLPSNFVRYVLITRDGRLWVGTDAGVALRNGQRFEPWAMQAGLAGPNIRRIIEDPDGTLWFCSDAWLHPDLPSGLAAYRAGVWTVYTEADGLPSNYVSDLFIDSQGRRFALTRAGLAQRVAGRWTQPWAAQGLPGREVYVWSMAEEAGGTVIAATTEAFFVLQDGVWSQVPNQPGGFFDNPKIAATQDGTVFTVTTYGGLRQFYVWRDGGFVPVTEPFTATGGIDFVTEAPDRSIWATGDGILLRWQRTQAEWTAYASLPPLHAVDAQARAWFADEHGAMVYDDGTWHARPDGRGLVGFGEAGTLWTWAGDQLIRHTPGARTAYPAATTGLDTLLAVHRDTNGDFWFRGRDAQGRARLARYDGTGWTRIIPDELPSSHISMSMPDPAGGYWYLLYAKQAGTLRLVHLDEHGHKRILEPGFTSTERPYFHIDRQGRLWLFGEFGLMRRAGEGWVPTPGLPGGIITSVTERGDELWVAYRGLSSGHNGFSRYVDGRWTHFDYFVRDVFKGATDDTFFFVDYDRRGLYVVSPGSGGLPVPLSLPTDAGIRHLAQSPDGVVWIQTTEAVLRYRPDGIPPETRLTAETAGAMQAGLLPVRFDGVERFKPRNAGAFTYSWRFDDRAWTAFAPAPETGLPVDGLATGQHVLEVRARDESLDVDPTPARLAFTVHAMPLQERAWFLPALGSVFFLILMLGLMTVASRRKLRYYATHLEDQVKTRTEALRESEEKYRLLFATGQDAILIIDRDAETIIDANAAALRLYGYSREAMLTLRASRLAASSDQDLGAAGLLELAASPPTHVNAVAHQKADGSVFPVEIAVGTFVLHGRMMVYAVIRDITERQRAAREREAFIAEVEARNAELERFTYTVSHDLKTPLVTIKGFLGLLQKDMAGGDAERAARDIEQIASAADTMSRLLQDLLDLSRTGRLMNPPEAVSLSPLAREAADMKGIRKLAQGIRLTIAPSMPAVLGDRLRLLEVYQNLIDNAVKFMGDQPKPLIEIGARQQNGEVVCFVRDNGMGIEEQYHENVFGLFNRLNTDTEGTGIGLALVRRIVEVHGGRIWIESEGHKQGSTFWFTLPVHAAEEEPRQLP